MKKYKLCEGVTINYGHEPLYETCDNIVTLYRIVALQDFRDVQKGDVGGFVTGESNLSHEGDCWIYDDAKCTGESVIKGDARIFNNVEVGGRSTISGAARLTNNVKIYGSCLSSSDGGVNIDGCVVVSDNVCITGKNTRLCNFAMVSGDVKIYGDDVSIGEASEICGKN